MYGNISAILNHRVPYTLYKFGGKIIKRTLVIALKFRYLYLDLIFIQDNIKHQLLSCNKHDDAFLASDITSHSNLIHGIHNVPFAWKQNLGIIISCLNNIDQENYQKSRPTLTRIVSKVIYLGLEHGQRY